MPPPTGSWAATSPDPTPPNSFTRPSSRCTPAPATPTSPTPSTSTPPSPKASTPPPAESTARSAPSRQPDQHLQGDDSVGHTASRSPAISDARARTVRAARPSATPDPTPRRRPIDHRRGSSSGRRLDRRRAARRTGPPPRRRLGRRRPDRWVRPDPSSDPHRFTFDDQTVYASCASDTFELPVMLGRPSVTESVCPVIGQPVRVDITPDQVVTVDPPAAVVSKIRPDHAVDDVRAEICNLGSFFSSAAAAGDWLASHPEGRSRRSAKTSRSPGKRSSNSAGSRLDGGQGVQDRLDTRIQVCATGARAGTEVDTVREQREEFRRTGPIDVSPDLALAAGNLQRRGEGGPEFVVVAVQRAPGGLARLLGVRIRDQASPARMLARAAQLDQPVEECRDRGKSAAIGGEPVAHRARALLEIPLQRREIQLLLAAERVVDAGSTEPRRGHDVVDSGGRDPLAPEQALDRRQRVRAVEVFDIRHATPLILERPIQDKGCA